MRANIASTSQAGSTWLRTTPIDVDCINASNARWWSAALSATHTLTARRTLQEPAPPGPVAAIL